MVTRLSVCKPDDRKSPIHGVISTHGIGKNIYIYMAFYSDLMGCYSDLMGFYSDLMGY